MNSIIPDLLSKTKEIPIYIILKQTNEEINKLTDMITYIVVQ